MPTYTYQCADCEHSYDAFQSMKADPDTVCPECNGKVERLIGAGAGIVFKGSGFYVTDYRSGGKSGDNAEGKAASDDGGSAKKSEPAASSTPASDSTASTPATSSSKSSESKGSGKSSDA